MELLAPYIQSSRLPEFVVGHRYEILDYEDNIFCGSVYMITEDKVFFRGIYSDCFSVSGEELMYLKGEIIVAVLTDCDPPDELW